MLVHDTVTKKTHIQTAIPGPKSKAIYDAEQRYISPGIQTIASLSQLAMEKGEGCVVEDVDGNRYIDFFAGVAVASLGYNHPRYVRAIQDQVARIHVGSFATKCAPICRNCWPIMRSATCAVLNIIAAARRRSRPPSVSRNLLQKKRR